MNGHSRASVISAKLPRLVVSYSVSSGFFPLVVFHDTAPVSAAHD